MEELNIMELLKNKEKKAIIKFENSGKYNIKVKNVAHSYLAINVSLQNMTDIDKLIRKLINNNVKMVILDNINIVLEKDLSVNDILKKLNNVKITFLNVKNNYNKKSVEINKEKNTVAYLFLKKDSNRLYCKNVLEDFVKKYEIEISDVYIDEVQTNTSINEKYSLRRLLKDIKEKNIGQILIPGVEHISRKTEEIYETVKFASSEGANIICCKNDCIL